MAGQYMKRSTMELGGHGPVIVAEDADLQKTANDMAFFKYMNAGQICVSPTRFLVQEKVYDDFVGKFVERAKAVKVGDPMDRSVQMGPVVSERRLVQIEELVSDAVAKGAQTPAGGRRIGNEGNFFEPTVLTGLNKDMRIMNEEPFGPLALMIPYKTLDDAIEEANRLPYGLGAYAFTTNAHSIQRIIKEVEAGMVRVNGGGGGTETPFGGVRDSGVGSDGGPEAIEAYQVWKFVAQGAI
jgi:succinate-semialdehyde dehydrogenase/glutarate-semialdehyde dehydrogenase